MQAVKPKPGLQVSLDLQRVPQHAAQGQAVPRLCKTTRGSQVRGLSAGASSHSEIAPPSLQRKSRGTPNALGGVSLSCTIKQEKLSLGATKWGRAQTPQRK